MFPMDIVAGTCSNEDFWNEMSVKGLQRSWRHHHRLWPSQLAGRRRPPRERSGVALVCTGPHFTEWSLRDYSGNIFFS